MKQIVILVLGLVLVACDDEPPPPSPTEKAATPAVVARSFDFAQLTRGGRLFQQNCASCHGREAQGASNWRQRDADGKFPPPPLNGTGHAWHHPKKALISTIKNGTARIGGNMPPWRDKLSDQDIDDIISWFQAKWSDEIYTVWYKKDQQSQR